MLGSPHPRARICSCRLLGNLAWYQSITPAVLELEPSEQLVFLLDDKHSDVIREATAALTRLSRWVGGAKGVVDAKALDHVLLLLESPNPDTRRWACMLMGNLASHESTAQAILKLKLSVQLVSLLRAEDSLVPYVTCTLSQIARWEEGAKSVVDAKALDHVLVLLKSPDSSARKWACVLTGYLAFRESTAPAILKLNPSVQLVSLLDDEDHVVRWATYTLSQIARWVDGVKDVVDAKALDHVLRLLKSPNLDTRRWACGLALALHAFTAPGILKVNPSMQLVSLLDDEDFLVYQATYALSQIARWEEGAQGVVDAKALDHVLTLLKSPNPDTRRCACELAGHLALHESTASAISKLNPSVQLVSLLGETYCATYALSRIARWEEGAEGVVDALALYYVSALLKSPNLDTRRCACELVGHLALHESTELAISKLNPSVQLVSLLGDQDSFSHATYALAQIARWEKGAQGVVDAKALDHVLALLESPTRTLGDVLVS
ncbi:armadillo-type protein [Mycena olivaceomarginata]|nr:armadillo-type protein [Mycena olivaceomarginata]